MNSISGGVRGETTVSSALKQVLVAVAAFLAVSALVLSTLVIMPSVHAAPGDDSETTVSQDDSQQDSQAGDNTASKPNSTQTSVRPADPAAATQEDESDASLDRSTLDANQNHVGFRNVGTPKNWADEYIESVDVFKSGADTPLTGPPAKETDLVVGVPIVFQVNWSARGKEQAAPGDVLSVQLPPWLKLNGELNTPMSDVGTCVGKSQSRDIVCTFGPRAEDVRIGEGYLKFTAATVETDSADKFKLGTVDVEAYYYFTGRHSGPVKVGTVSQENLSADIVKTGQFSTEYEIEGRKYVQMVWRVVIPPSKVNEFVDAGAAIEIVDHLQPMTVVDPDTKKEVQVPQFIAPTQRGPYNVARRDGASLEKGVWNTKQEDAQCRPGGKFVDAGITCAEKIYGNSGAAFSYDENARRGETITFTGVTPNESWEKTSTFTARIENPVRDAAYRVQFFSAIPADLVKLQSSKSPKVKNVAQINGVDVASKNDAVVYVRSEVGANTYKDSTNFVVKKEVLPDYQASDVKEFTLRYKVGDKAGECKVAPGSDCRIEKVPLGTKVVIEEPEVQGSKLNWQRGEFSYVNEADNKTKVVFDGAKATIDAPVPGERVVLLLSNSFSNKTGNLRLKKEVRGLANPDLAKPMVEVDYTCVPAGQPENSGTTVRVEVPTNGDVKSISDIPVGHDCYVSENVSSAEIPKHRIDVSYSPESRKVTIKEGDGENNSNLVSINNSYTLNTAPLFLKKAIAGERPADLNDNTEFTVKYQCNEDSADGKVKANQPAELKIKANGDAAKAGEFPLGAQCSVVEENMNAPKFEDFGYTPDLGATVTVAVNADESTVTVTNTFKKDEAPFRIIKAITGDGLNDAAQKNFEFEYVCGAETGRLQVTGAGEVVSDKTFPVGTECTITELGTEPNGAANLANHVLTVQPEATQRIVVGKREDVRFTNHYTVNKAKFAVAKTAEGEDGKAREHMFTFNYTCAGVTGTIRAKGDGVAVESDNEFPVGTVCQIVENPASAEIADYNDVTDPNARTQDVTIGEGNVVRAEFRNYYARKVGRFAVTKTVTADADVQAPATFNFDYTCQLGDQVIKGEILDVPANGSKESADIPTNARCTVTERDATVPGASLVTQIGEMVTIAENNLPQVEVSNTYTKDFGDFTITKSVVDPDGIAAGKVFEFDYLCLPPNHRNNEKPVEGKLRVKAGETVTSPKIPAEFNCAIFEIGGDIADSDLLIDGVNTKLIIQNGKTGRFEVENRYFQWKGSLEISKEISGSEAVKQAVGAHQFDVSYVCVKDGKTTNEGTVKIAAGQPVMVDDIVANSECTITENPDSAVIGALRFEPAGSTTKVAAPPIVANNGMSKAKLINAYAEQGKFAVVKHVEGVQGGAADKQFTFTYTCGAEAGTLMVRGDGKPVESDKAFPVGTECTVTEDADSAAIADHTDQTAGAERVKKITVGAGAPATAEFTNVYARDMGKFRVTKKVIADADLAIPSEFQVDYRCTKQGDEPREGTLTVPNNGSVESPEMPTGYACVVTREHDASTPGATLVTNIGSGVQLAKGGVPEIEVTNTYRKDFGEFTITKEVIDPDGVAAGKVFEFHYVCTPPEHRKDEKPVEGRLKVKAGESATSPKIPAEFSCTITEVGAEVADSNLVTSGLDSKLTIKNGENKPIEVTNKYSQWKGSLVISKAIIGTPAVEQLAAGHEFEVKFKCVKDGKTTNEDRVKLKAGQTVTFDGIPANSACTVEENTEAVSVDNLRFSKDASTTRIDAPKITAHGGVTEAQLRNAYVELGHFTVTKELAGLTGNAGHNDREFEIVASWTDNGNTVEKEFKIRADQEFKDFPALPVGTKVTLKEKHPGNNAVQQWNTPGFTSDRVGAIVDNGDGTAVLTVQSGTPADKPLKVTLTNTANPPWWWLAVPGALILGGSGSSGNVGSSTPAPGVQPQGQAPSGPTAKSNASATLARTGASVLGVIAVAGAAVALGVYLVRRGRKDS